MKEILLEGLAKNVEEATVQTWFVEEGDPVTEGDDLVELNTEDGTITITAPASGVLAEVYYDEGEVVGRGEILCTIDEDSDNDDEDEDEEDEDIDEDDDEDEDEDGGDDEDDDEDADEDEDEEDYDEDEE